MCEKRWTVVPKEDPETGDLFIELPEDALLQVGWKVGDTLDWHDNKDGTFTLEKKKTTDDSPTHE